MAFPHGFAACLRACSSAAFWAALLMPLLRRLLLRLLLLLRRATGCVFPHCVESTSPQTAHSTAPPRASTTAVPRFIVSVCPRRPTSRSRVCCWLADDTGRVLLRPSTFRFGQGNDQLRWLAGRDGSNAQGSDAATHCHRGVSPRPRRATARATYRAPPIARGRPGPGPLRLMQVHYTGKHNIPWYLQVLYTTRTVRSLQTKYKNYKGFVFLP